MTTILWHLVCAFIIMYNEHQSSKSTFLNAMIDGVARSVSNLPVIKWQLTNSSKKCVVKEAGTPTFMLHIEYKTANREAAFAAVGLLIGQNCARLEMVTAV
ncbi:MAG TPA: hypothetical protein VEL31_21210 [Ktedonobacteraceae bacterium]|nr:hypothetical protein [Ktedonobacteraceae bacterium]